MDSGGTLLVVACRLRVATSTGPSAHLAWSLVGLLSVPGCPFYGPGIFVQGSFLHKNALLKRLFVQRLQGQRISEMDL